MPITIHVEGLAVHLGLLQLLGTRWSRFVHRGILALVRPVPRLQAPLAHDAGAAATQARRLQPHTQIQALEGPRMAGG